MSEGRLEVRGRQSRWRSGVPDAVAAVLLVLPVVFWPGPLGGAPMAPIAALLVAWIAWRDVSSYTIPDAALAALSLIAALDRAMEPLFRIDWPLAVASFGLDGLLCGGSILLVREVYFRRRGHDGIGLGDVKLAMVGGFLCGLSGFSVALLGASLCGLVAAMLAGRLNLSEISRKIPFGAILAPALLLAWLAGA